MNQAKRKLKIDLMDLESAFEHHDFSMEMDYFLDLETGEVVLVTGEERRLLEDVYWIIRRSASVGSSSVMSACASAF